jgi:hypothetical protein
MSKELHVMNKRSTSRHIGLLFFAGGGEPAKNLEVQRKITTIKSSPGILPNLRIIHLNYKYALYNLDDEIWHVNANWVSEPHTIWNLAFLTPPPPPQTQRGDC